MAPGQEAGGGTSALSNGAEGGFLNRGLTAPPLPVKRSPFQALSTYVMAEVQKVGKCAGKRNHCTLHCCSAFILEKPTVSVKVPDLMHTRTIYLQLLDGKQP